MSREAMQLALEALESDPISHAGLVSRKQAITALRQALETEREWVGLTEPELHQINPTWPAPGQHWDYEDVLAFVRAVEAKLKEKNHG
jgi:hypothetical protein